MRAEPSSLPSSDQDRRRSRSRTSTSSSPIDPLTPTSPPSSRYGLCPRVPLPDLRLSSSGNLLPRPLGVESLAPRFVTHDSLLPPFSPSHTHLSHAGDGGGKYTGIHTLYHSLALTLSSFFCSRSVLLLLMGILSTSVLILSFYSLPRM